MQRLLNRRDFLAAAQARSQACKSLVMQMRDRKDEAAPRLGFTCTKKLGNAVTRNRIRRRLKEAARMVMPTAARPGHDYVLIGRPPAETLGFEALKKDIISALTKLHGSQNGSASPSNKDQPT